MFVTLLFFLFQISFRNEYLIFLLIDIAKKIIDDNLNINLITIETKKFKTNMINVKK